MWVHSVSLRPAPLHVWIYLEARQTNMATKCTVSCCSSLPGWKLSAVAGPTTSRYVMGPLEPMVKSGLSRMLVTWVWIAELNCWLHPEGLSERFRFQTSICWYIMIYHAFFPVRLCNYHSWRCEVSLAQDCNGHADVDAESTQRCARQSGIEGGYQAIYPTNRANYSNGNDGFTWVNMVFFIMIYCYHWKLWSNYRTIATNPPQQR